MSQSTAKQIVKYLISSIKITGYSVSNSVSSSDVTSVITTALTTASNKGTSVPFALSTSKQVEGIIATSPENKIELWNTTTKQKLSYNGYQVYGRLINSGSTYTIDFLYYNGSELPYTFPSTLEIDFEFNYNFSFDDLPYDSFVGKNLRNIYSDPSLAFNTATTTNSGVVEVATTNEYLAGTDTDGSGNTLVPAPSDIQNQLLSQYNSLTNLIGSSVNVIDITYEDLLAKKYNNQLKDGQLYKITNFRSVYTQTITNIVTDSGIYDPLIVRGLIDKINNIQYIGNVAVSSLYTEHVIGYNFENEGLVLSISGTVVVIGTVTVCNGFSIITTNSANIIASLTSNNSIESIQLNTGGSATTRASITYDFSNYTIANVINSDWSSFGNAWVLALINSRTDLLAWWNSLGGTAQTNYLNTLTSTTGSGIIPIINEPIIYNVISGYRRVIVGAKVQQDLRSTLIGLGGFWSALATAATSFVTFSPVLKITSPLGTEFDYSFNGYVETVSGGCFSTNEGYIFNITSGSNFTIDGKYGKILYRKNLIKNITTWYDYTQIKFRRWETAAHTGIYTATTDPGGGAFYEDLYTFNDNIASNCNNIELGKPISQEFSNIIFTGTCTDIFLKDRLVNLTYNNTVQIGYKELNAINDSFVLGTWESDTTNTATRGAIATMYENILSNTQDYIQTKLGAFNSLQQNSALLPGRFYYITDFFNNPSSLPSNVILTPETEAVIVLAVTNNQIHNLSYSVTYNDIISIVFDENTDSNLVSTQRSDCFLVNSTYSSINLGISLVSTTTVDLNKVQFSSAIWYFYNQGNITGFGIKDVTDNITTSLNILSPGSFSITGGKNYSFYFIYNGVTIYSTESLNISNPFPWFLSNLNFEIVYRKDFNKNLTTWFDFRSLQFVWWETSFGSGNYTSYTNPGGGARTTNYWTFNDQNGTNCKNIELGKPTVQEYSNVIFLNTCYNIFLKDDLVNYLYNTLNGIGWKETQTDDSEYIEQSFTSVTSLTVTHNWNKKPVVTVVDPSETVVAATIEYINNNQVLISFGSAKTGTAIVQGTFGSPVLYGYNTIQDNGSNMTQRSILNFILPSGATITDVAGVTTVNLTGITTNDIYGYNTSVPTTVTVGGIPAGSTFSPTQLVNQLLYQMLNPFQNPSPVGISLNPSLAEKGTTITSMIINYTLSDNSGIPSSKTLFNNLVSILSLATNAPSGSYTQTGLNVTFASNTNQRTWNFQINYSNYSTLTANVTLNFVAPIFYGIGSATAMSSINTVGNLNTSFPGSKQIRNNFALSNVPFNGTNVYTYFIYPAILGDLTSIIDQNGFQTISGWTKTQKSILLQDGITLEIYNIYTSNNIASYSNFKYSFS